MTHAYRLHYAPDNASLAVRLALEEAGLGYATAPVHRSRGDLSNPDYLALNPNGLIPVLETPEGAIFETGAILLWLADRHPEAGLFPPPQSDERGAALKWLFWLSNTLHAAEITLFYPEKQIASEGGMPAALRARAATRIGGLLDILEHGPDTGWIEGDGASILSCYLAVLLRWPALYGGDAGWYRLAHWPRLAAFAARFETRPAARRMARAEGLGERPFSQPQEADPPEGSVF